MNEYTQNKNESKNSDDFKIIFEFCLNKFNRCLT